VQDNILKNAWVQTAVNFENHCSRNALCEEKEVSVCGVRQTLLENLIFISINSWLYVKPKLNILIN
jgi:hypothetical protein